MDHQLETTHAVQRRADPARSGCVPETSHGGGRARVGDLQLSLAADPVQLDALEGAVRSVHAAVQRFAAGGGAGDVHAAAARGTSGAGGRLPHYDRIQASFGRQHDVSDVQAYVGGPAAGACADMGARGYATGRQVAFAREPSLQLAAHEAAHVVQQRSGAVQLAGGVGQVGDRWEQNADAVAQRVVQGRSAEDILPSAGGASAGVQRSVQRDEAAGPEPEAAAAPASPAPAAAKPAIGEATQKPTDADAGAEKTFSWRGAELKVKVGASALEVEGSYQLGELKLPPVPIAYGVFLVPELKAKANGKGKRSHDGAVELTLGGEVSGQLTIEGGIPGVATIYAGPKLTVGFNALKVSWAAGGKPEWDNFSVPLKASFIVGAQLNVLGAKEFLDAAQGVYANWFAKGAGGKGTVGGDAKEKNDKKVNSGFKLEWPIGGEFELFRARLTGGAYELVRGENFNAFVEKLDALAKLPERVKSAVLGPEQKVINGPASDEFASMRRVAVVPFESKPKAPAAAE